MRITEFEPQDNVMIRLIGEDQWADYANIRCEMLLSDPDAFPLQAFADLDDPEEKWRERILNSDVMLAYDGDVPIGMVRATYDGDVAMLRNMYTNAEYRGRGLGKRLMMAAMNSLESRGAAKATLEVEDSQEVAQRMYKGLGFEETGRIQDGNGFMITMSKDIQSS